MRSGTRAPRWRRSHRQQNGYVRGAGQAWQATSTAALLLAGTAALLLAGLLALAVSNAARAYPPPRVTPLPFVFDGSVAALTRDGLGNTYVGGTFTQELAPTGSGLVLSAAGEGAPNPSTFPHVIGKVLAAKPDGTGGWYIGGSFTSVGGVARQSLAHILSDGEVDPAWNPAPTGGSVVYDDASAVIDALALSGSTLYVGGDFTSIAGQPRASLAALDAGTGQATSWNPGTSLEFEGEPGLVRALLVDGSTVFAGGQFAAVGGQPRVNLAAIDASTGGVLGWNPGAGGTVYALAVSGSDVFVGGSFSTIAGQSLNNLAAIDIASGLAIPWNPSPSGPVHALAISGSSVYVGGSFSSIGGQPRNGLAAINPESGNATEWNPNPTRFCQTSVATLSVSGSTVYVGGSFTSIGGQPRMDIAAVDATSGTATEWNPDPSDFDPAGCAFTETPVDVIATAGSTIYAGGDFAGAGPALARIDGVAKVTPEGNLDTSFHPLAPSSSIIKSLAVSGSTLYVGGQFFLLGEPERGDLAALDTSTGEATPWNPAPNQSVSALAVSGSTVYAGGSFTAVNTENGLGGVERKGLAAFDATTGLALPWNPQANGPEGFASVDALALSESTLYVGGRFTTIEGQERDGLAGFDLASGGMSEWNPQAGAEGLFTPTVNAVAVAGSTVYLAGNFLSIGGQRRGSLAAVQATSGAPISWNPVTTGGGTPTTIATLGSTVYVGGNFNAVGVLTPSVSRIDLAAIDAESGAATGWDPEDNAGDQLGFVDALAASGATVYAGGEFDFMGGQATGPFAEISTETPPSAVPLPFVAPPATPAIPSPGRGSTVLSATPAPVLAIRQRVTVTAGKVTVRLKGTGRFVPLSGATTIPDGSEVDATNGRVVLTVATLTRGRTEAAEVYGGRFLIHQDRRAPAETHMTLSLPLGGCPRAALAQSVTAPAPANSATRPSRARARHLWVSEHGGSWGTKGHYVSTTVEGTRWLTLDRCDRSEVKVASGKVRVRDLIRNHTKTITTGQTYVAIAPSSKARG
jgi:trimeric autotransporter adhesin